MAGRYKFVVANRNGTTFYGELSTAILVSITYPLSDIGRWVVAFSNADPMAGAVAKQYFIIRELQIWRDGVLLMAGPILSGKLDEGGVVTLQGADPLWYFSGKFLGPPNSERIVNGNFGSGLSSWSNPGGPTSSVSTTTRARGTQAARLVEGAAAQDHYITQSVTETLAGTIGTQTGFYLRGWFYLEAFSAPAYLERGLYANSILQPSAVLYDEKWAPINRSSPFELWTPLDVLLSVPLGESFSWDVRLYAPEGTVVWDSITMQPQIGDGSYTFVELNTILSGIFAGLAAKDTTSANVTYGGVTTGVTLARPYWRHEHANFVAILNEHVANGLIDYGVTYNSTGTVRTLQLYAPTRGSLKTQFALETSRNIASYGTFAIDGAGVTNKPRVLARASGVTGEFAQAVDLAALDGLAIEDVLGAPDFVQASAPDFVPLAGLDYYAPQVLANRKAPLSTYTLVTKPESTPELFGALTAGALVPGDTVPVRIDDGWAQEDANRRIREITYRGDETLAIGVF